MSTTAGVFSETTLLNIRAMADAIMFDDRIKLNYQAQTKVLDVIPMVQTANVRPLTGKKDVTIEVEWMNNCAIVAEDCEDCAVGGPELSTNTQTYTIDTCVQAPFSVRGYKFIDNDFNAQEAIAKGLLSADKVISENIAIAFLDWLVLNAGTNEWAGAGEIGTVVGNETQIAAADFDVDAIGYILKCYLYNRLNNPQSISGNQLYEDWQNAFFASGAFANAAGNQGRFDSLKPLWDLWNFNAAGYNDRLIGISTGAIAAASKTYYGPAVEEFGKEGVRWSIQSRWIPWLNLDVSMNYNCENDIIGWDFNVKGRYGFFLNPEGCTTGNNGILQFVSV